MRFDDRLQTMLSRDLSHPPAAAAAWAQVADLLAQEGRAMTPEIGARGLAILSLLREAVPLAARAAAVRAIAGRCSFAPLAVLLASEPPSIVAPLFDRLRLNESEWLSILADIGPLARSRLRVRADLPVGVGRALADFGSTDFALPMSHAMEPPAAVQSVTELPESQGSAIAELVDRIERWRQRRDGGDGAEAVLVDAPASADVLFSTDSEGLLRAVHGLPRAALVGISLSRPADVGDAGVDAGVARAFQKRTPIHGGRMLLGGGTLWSGLWVIDAQPEFDRASGRFTGYRGSLSPAGDHVSTAEPPTEANHPDSIRQMLHELRSPLNAISGFSQLIDGQYFGPVPSTYRMLNRAILRDAARLNSSIEDLALSADLDAGIYRAEEGTAPLAAAVAALAPAEASPVMGDATIALDPAVLHGLLQRARRALDPEENAPVRLHCSRANDGWAVELALVEPVVAAGGEAARQAARSLAVKLAEAHGVPLALADNSVILNLPGARAVAELAG